ncbi:FAD-binding oxidoreductase [Glaciimonas sp. PCH181]|uniref:NAD(P)/FAD-dependent oxidoreductase n=1 Tax=Glaciimonas sp. PCH181 TaxID=2133943 RepID=UPI000D34C9D9|nr:FAD-dependent oxidoreductase [Glaciimonas sp. PCH181]PUA20065.1 hypothetical protein C7W93_09780 [Glaciimonas sp. PCH181]
MIIVIGAGVIGASVAYRLASAGAAVTLLDAGRIGGGTSSTSFAWVNSHHKTPRAYHDLNFAGMQAHRELREVFGDAPWWHGGGTIEWEGGTEDDHIKYRQKVALLQSWDYAAEWLDHRQLLALEPDIDLTAVGDAPVAYFPDDGWIDPVVYCQALISAAKKFGAKVKLNTRVSSLTMTRQRVTGTVTEDGTTHAADMVINCTGRWADQTSFPTSLRVPLAPSAGLMVFTPPVASNVSRVIFSPNVHIRPDGAGRLLICRNDLDLSLSSGTTPSIDSPQVSALLQAATKVLPALAGVEAEAVRVGIRAIPADQFPAIGPIPDVDGYYVAVTHSGVTLAPYIGLAVADELLNKAIRSELESFRPSRFASQSR